MRAVKNIAYIMYRRCAPLIYKKYRERHHNYDRIYHVHIRKCAGTSFNKSFIRSIGGDDDLYDRLAKKLDHRLTVNNRPIVGWNKVLIENGCYWYGFSHLPYHSLRLPSNTFTFTFIRDPFERILSHYNMINDMIMDRVNHPALTEEGEWVKNGFKGFIESIPRSHRENQLFMFDNEFNVERALRRIELIDYIGRIEEIESQFVPFLNNNLGIVLPYRHIRKSKSKYEPSKEEYNIAMEALRDEYKFYNKVLSRMT